MKKYYFVFLLLFTLTVFGQKSQLPEDFVVLNKYMPEAYYEIRYAGNHNFTGRPVTGYKAPLAILSKSAAQALCEVQQELQRMGYCLKIFDAYRPQKAVDYFIAWARKPGDTLGKQEFYPHIPKNELFERGYIASKSGHTRGSTVDLTLENCQTGEEVDMGSPYDFFGEISHHDSEKVTPAQKANRKFLKMVMQKHGFRPYSEEWWHYTLKKEPFPETYFNFEIPIN